jgi:hypothetical protein
MAIPPELIRDDRQAPKIALTQSSEEHAAYVGELFRQLTNLNAIPPQFMKPEAKPQVSFRPVCVQDGRWQAEIITPAGIPTYRDPLGQKGQLHKVDLRITGNSPMCMQVLEMRQEAWPYPYHETWPYTSKSEQQSPFEAKLNFQEEFERHAAQYEYRKFRLYE